MKLWPRRKPALQQQMTLMASSIAEELRALSGDIGRLRNDLDRQVTVARHVYEPITPTVLQVTTNLTDRSGRSWQVIMREPGQPTYIDLGQAGQVVIEPVRWAVEHKHTKDERW